MSMYSEVKKAIDAMDWLTDADLGAVALAKLYARQLDDLERGRGEEGAGSGVAYLGAQLRTILTDLGGTPKGADIRKNGQPKEGGRLAHLRAVK